MRIGLRDIALACGVSVSTVGKVLNPATGGNTRVSDVTAARVHEAALKLHYQPNMSARNLRTGGSQVIGVLIDSAVAGGFARMVASIERTAASHGYQLMVSEEHDSVSRIIAGYEHLRQYGVAGVICVSHDYPGESDDLYGFFQGRPRLVFVGRPRLSESCYVDTCDVEKAHLAVEYLWRRGRRRIGMLSSSRAHQTLSAWRQGFQDAIESMGGRLGEHGKLFSVEYGDISPLSIRAAVDSAVAGGLLDWRCDAVVCSGDEIAGYLMRNLQGRGLRIPDDIAVTGHGNDRFCEILEPALATVDDNQEAQGREAVELLLKMVEGSQAEGRGYGYVSEVHPSLVIRPSAG